MKRTWPAVAPAKGTAALSPPPRGAAERLLRRPQRSQHAHGDALACLHTAMEGARPPRWRAPVFKLFISGFGNGGPGGMPFRAILEIPECGYHHNSWAIPIRPVQFGRFARLVRGPSSSQGQRQGRKGGNKAPPATAPQGPRGVAYSGMGACVC